DSLVVGDLAAVGHHAAHVLPGDLNHLDGDPTVVDEQAVAGADLLRQPRVRSGDPRPRTPDVLASDDDPATGVPLDRARFGPAAGRTAPGGSSVPGGRRVCRSAGPRPAPLGVPG